MTKVCNNSYRYVIMLGIGIVNDLKNLFPPVIELVGLRLGFDEECPYLASITI
jgi:hypothetical protein